MNLLSWLRATFVSGGPTRSPSPADIVLLTEADDEATAGLYQNLLQQQGIHCVLQNVSATAYLQFGQSWEVRVQYQDLARAAEILDIQPPS